MKIEIIKQNYPLQFVFIKSLIMPVNSQKQFLTKKNEIVTVFHLKQILSGVSVTDFYQILKSDNSQISPLTSEGVKRYINF